MAEPSVSDEEQIKRRLLWKKVTDPSFVEENKSTRKLYQRNALSKAGVPMLPEDLLRGSSSNVSESKMVKNMSINPLVPVGMIATVGCLIGMLKSSLNRNQMRTQYYMRGRIAAQAFTVLALVGGAALLGLDPRGYSSPGKIPKDQPDSITQTLLGNKN
ncbi:HIG1 domain-containing protein [Aphelenchoides bicaudatus]|nr:HIG1 domain-containing protein [Aphelenchoides bicaudatus]